MITSPWATEKELQIESYKILSKIELVSIALREIQSSNLAVRCSTVLDEVCKQMDAFDEALQNGIIAEDKIQEYRKKEVNKND